MPYKTRPQCRIEGCSGLVNAKMLCSKHYYRLRVNGSPAVVQERTRAKCSAHGCPSEAWANSLCSKHLSRLKRHGTTGNPRPTVAERFWVKVNKSGPIPDYAPHLGNCWIWTGSSNKDGHGHFFPERRTLAGAHRWLYEQTNGPVDPALHLDHLCRVPACVRPDHLEPVTPKENAVRGVRARKGQAK